MFLQIFKNEQWSLYKVQTDLKHPAFLSHQTPELLELRVLLGLGHLCLIQFLAKHFIMGAVAGQALLWVGIGETNKQKYKQTSNALNDRHEQN